MKKLTQYLVPLTLASIVTLPACAQVPAAEQTERAEAHERAEHREARRAVWFEHIHGESDGEMPHPPRPPRAGAPHIMEQVTIVRREALEEQFNEFDLDNDGYVNVNELKEVMERQAREKAEALFTRLDQDGTGMVDQQAFIDNIHGFRVIDRERIRARAEAAREMHEEARRRMEVIIHDENGERVVEERIFGPMPEGEYEFIIEREFSGEVELEVEEEEVEEEGSGNGS